jgi:anti-anti-sigma factor
MGGHLQFEATEQPDAIVIRLAGDLDVATCRAAQKAIASVIDPARRLVIDLSRVTYFGAAALRLLEEVQLDAAGMDTELVLQHPNRLVRRVLSITWNRSTLPLSLPTVLGCGEPDRRTVTVLDEALSTARRVTGAAMGTAQVRDPVEGALHLAAGHGFARPFLSYFDTVGDDNDSACGTAMHDGRPAWVADVCTSRVFAGTPALPVLLEAGVRAVASVPVFDAADSVVAVLSTHHRFPFDWSDGERSQLTEVAAATGRLLR